MPPGLRGHRILLVREPATDGRCAVNAACLRRTIAVRAARTLLRAAVPAAWAIGRARAAIVRVRWAWRCRGKPVPGDGEPLTRDEIQALGNLAAGRDVRART